MSRLSCLMLIFLYFFYFFYLSHALRNGFSVELIHRDSLKSPIYNPTETKFQRVNNIVRRSINRVNHFNKQFSLNTNEPISTLTPDSGEYFMSYSVGTPPFKTYGMMDTGSDLIWLQCLPCYECFNQTSLIFNPSKSLSYKNISCTSKKCKHANDVVPSCSKNKNICEYTYGYGDGSNSRGKLSAETLTLDSTSGFSVAFRKIVVGCGHNNTVSFTGRMSGVVGMGNGPISLIQQLGSSIGRKFSYCLMPFYDGESRLSNKLNFGSFAIVSGETVVSTPMIKIKEGYYMILEAFSVGNKRIEYEGYKIEGTYTKNMKIDSGTSMTMLPLDFHTKLESTVIEMVKLQRVELPNHELGLCYNTTWEQPNNFPAITAHFSGADVTLNSNSTFFEYQEGIMCLAIFPSLGAVFGNFAQYNHLIGYDLEENVISFKPTDCTKY